MKKISLLLALCLTLSLFAGCGDAQPTETAVATTTVATTAAPETTQETVPPTTMPEPEVIDFQLTLPQGFEPSLVEEDRFGYLGPNAPRDTSSITVEVLPMDESVLSVTADEFAQRNEVVPTEATEATEPSGDADETTEATEPVPQGPTDFNLLDYQNSTVDGWPAIFAEYSLIFPDYAIHFYRYEVVVNFHNYVFTFADSTDDNRWLEDFDACAGTINLVLNIDSIELDYSGLTWYDLGCGLGMYAEEGLEPQKASGFTACLGNRNAILLLMADEKEENNLTDMDLSDYADLLCQTNDLESFRRDSYGNLITTFYSTDENGVEYYNTIAVKETMDAFWVCQMACLATDQAAYAREFCLWASSIAGE